MKWTSPPKYLVETSVYENINVMWLIRFIKNTDATLKYRIHITDVHVLSISFSLECFLSPLFYPFFQLLFYFLGFTQSFLTLFVSYFVKIWQQLSPIDECDCECSKNTKKYNWECCKPWRHISFVRSI